MHYLSMHILSQRNNVMVTDEVMPRWRILVRTDACQRITNQHFMDRVMSAHHHVCDMQLYYC